MSEPTGAPTVEECSLTNDFGQKVQVVLGFLVIIVLSTEYMVERVSSSCKGERPRRDAVQFWFDMFKICVGAAVSHLYNVLVAMFLSNKEENGDECALYALAFIYEGSGVPFVQLLTYCVVKYAESKHRTSRIWGAISRPGQYNHAQVFEHLRCNDRKFQIITAISVGFAIMNLVLGISLKMSEMVTYVGPIFIFIFVFSALFSTTEARIQIVTWSCIKIFEKGVWTAFVILQADYFANWSHDMEIANEPHLESLLYVCIIPIVMNAFMFFMFSRIARLNLPCITVKQRSAEGQSFDMQEAMKVGIVFLMMVNTVIYLGMCIAFRSAEVAVVLLLSVLLAPLAISLVFIYLAKHVINSSYADTDQETFLTDHHDTQKAWNLSNISGDDPQVNDEEYAPPDLNSSRDPTQPDMHAGSMKKETSLQRITDDQAK